MTRLVAAHPAYTIGVATSVPPPQRLDPVRTPEALLFPNRRTASAMYAALSPSGMSTTVVIRTEDIDDTVRVTGGTVTVQCSGLPLLSDAEIESRRESWTSALERAGHESRSWRFSPLHIRSLDARVDLPSDHVTGPPTVSANADTVEAVAVIELTAIGAQAWRQALEAGDPESLVGSVTFDFTFAAERQNRKVATQSHRASSPIGNLIAQSATQLRVLRAEVGVEARLVVRGHPSVDRIALSLRSADDVQTLVLPSEGGEVTMTLATADTAAAAISWTAEVSFSSAAWPLVATGGELSQTEGWVAILAPATWVRPIDVWTMYVDADGIAVGAESESTADRVAGSVELDADYLDGRSLHTSFEGRHNEMVTMHLPDPPDQTRGRLTLSAMVVRNGNLKTTNRELDSDDRWVIMKILPDATAEFSTNTSPMPEFGPADRERLELAALF